MTSIGAKFGLMRQSGSSCSDLSGLVGTWNDHETKLLRDNQFEPAQHHVCLESVVVLGESGCGVALAHTGRDEQFGRTQGKETAPVRLSHDLLDAIGGGPSGDHAHSCLRQHLTVIHRHHEVTDTKHIHCHFWLHRHVLSVCSDGSELSNTNIG